MNRPDPAEKREAYSERLYGLLIFFSFAAPPGEG